jgi:CRP-like cAMP-binding protein
MNNILKKILTASNFTEGENWTRRHFQNNEIIVEEGHEARSLFFIEEGMLRVAGDIELEAQKHIHPGIWDLGSGDIFGEFALYESQFRTASVRAISDGCLIEINAEKLGAYLDANPKQGYLLYKDLFAVLINRLKRANHRVNDLFAWGLKAHGIEEHL